MRPVSGLKTQIVALDAAMLVAVNSAEAGAVHKLRTSTRRVESQIALLEVLAGGTKPLVLPPHADEAEGVRKGLRRVRQAAGAVRDLDVQSKAIEEDAPAKEEVHKGSPGDAMRKEAKKLRKKILAQRDVEEAKLMAVLQDEAEGLAVHLRALEQVLKPANAQVVAQAVLLERMEFWFAQATREVLRTKVKSGETEKDALRRRVVGLSEESLHTVRKAAKLCRYMAESAAVGSTVRKAAGRFEAIQEAGGVWHDWLLLEQLSAEFHGKDARLTMRYRRHREAALAEYHLKLAELLPQV